MIQIMEPRRRLVTSHGRPVNVALALAEVIWILSGRDDVGMPSFYSSNIAQFSDDGFFFNAAYGHRLFKAQGFDQVDDIIRTLKDDPDSRQATMCIWHPDDRGWNPTGDKRQTKDRACNLISHAMVRGKKLEWTQIMRSNDVIWGLPYNFMQWTHIMEWVATRLGYSLGTYTHFADSLHMYDYHIETSESIKYFELYDVYPGHHSMQHVDYETLYHISECEEQIRRMYEPPYKGAAGIDKYWDSVLQILKAHHWYKKGEDMKTLETLLMTEADPIYAAAQCRFYYANRWHKAGYEDIRRQLQLSLSDDVSIWVAGA